jgi:hypothetical protein
MHEGTVTATGPNPPEQPVRSTVQSCPLEPSRTVAFRDRPHIAIGSDLEIVPNSAPTSAIGLLDLPTDHHALQTKPHWQRER